MASQAALEQARELLERANVATDDPRRTRIDLLQVANYIARLARGNRELRDLVSYISDFLGGQAITGEDLRVAGRNGWPVMEPVPGPASHFYAGLRLAGHAALRSPALIHDFEARIGDARSLTERVRRTVEGMDPDWASALTLVTADRAAEPGDFRSRLIAAAKDVQQLVTSDELPTWDDFAEGPTGSTWPPLTLGVYPVLGGLYKEDPDEDWTGEASGAGFATVAVCVLGFGMSGDEVKMLICVAAVILIIVIISLL